MTEAVIMAVMKELTKSHDNLTHLMSRFHFCTRWNVGKPLYCNSFHYSASYVVLLLTLVAFVKFKEREKHPWMSVLLVKLQANASNFTKSNTPQWVFFMFLKLSK